MCARNSLQCIAMREPGRALRPPLDPVITVLQRGRLSISRLPLLPNSETRCDSGVGGWPGSVSVSRLLVGLDIYCDEYTQIWVFLHSHAAPFSLPTSTRFASRQNKSFASCRILPESVGKSVKVHTLRDIHQWREASVA